MKKLITIMLCLILSLSVFATVGCGGGSVFNGNYKEATETEVEAFAQAVAEAEKGEEFNYNSGVKLELEISVESSEYNMDLSAEIKSIAVEEKLQMAGEMTMSGIMPGAEEEVEESNSAKIYYVDDYMYLDTKIEGEEMKIKQPMTVDEFIGSAGSMGNMGDMGLDLDSVTSLSQLLESMGEIPNVKISIDNGKSNNKIKIEATDEEMGAVGTAILVYDASYNLIAAKVEMEMSMQISDTESMAMSTSVVIEPWSGSIDLPSDLDTYTETML